MGSTKKLTLEEVQRRMNASRNNEYTIIGYYENTHAKALIRHNKCGYTWMTVPKTIISGEASCPVCSGVITKYNQSYKDKYDSLNLDLLGVKPGEIINKSKNYDFKCKICGYTFSIRLSNLDSMVKQFPGRTIGCAKCFRKTILSKFQKKYVDRFNNELKGKFELLSDYTDSYKKVKVKCLTCGHEFMVMPLDIFRYGCSFCVNNRNLNNEEFQARLDEKYGKGTYSLIGNYENSHTKVLVKHNKCGCVFSETPKNFITHDIGCPFCNVGSSQAQTELFDFIYSNFPDAVKNDRSILPSGREIDIYIPSKKIGIEYDGLYWHSEAMLGRTYQLDKTKEANSVGVRIIHIFEDEYINHKDLVMDKIKSILGLYDNKEKKIYGRKCIVKLINGSEKNDFLNANHIQGTDNSKLAYGAFYENKLVSVMTFSTPRCGIGKSVGKKDLYELERFASDRNYIVIGTFGKLLKEFVKEHKGSTIYSYGDLRWVSLKNNVYLKNGFTLDRVNKSNYWYFLGSVRYHRFGFCKAAIKRKFPEIYDDSLTEFQMMDKTKYGRIWDCGTARYILKM